MGNNSRKKKKSKPQQDTASTSQKSNSGFGVVVLGVAVCLGAAVYVLNANRTRTPAPPPSTEQANASGPAAPKPAALEPIELPDIPGVEKNRFDAMVRSVARLEDPVLDGWSTEAFNDVAGKQLKRVAKLIIHPEELSNAKLDDLVSETFSSAGLRPQQLETAFADSVYQVQRGDIGDQADAHGGIDGFQKVIEQLAEPLSGTSDHRYKFKVIRVQLGENGNETKAFFEISGRASEQATQLNAVWTCRWSGTDPKHPLLESIQVSNYEEVVCKTPSGGSLFADCTESIFRNTDRYERQLRYGIDYWIDQFDGAIARPAAGHGMAIDDVNGDGLEDVYLCQSPALPNLLLLQNPDGTVRDAAVESGVHWLEGTRAALLADLDNDGDQDLVCVLGSYVVIQANDGRGNFTSVTTIEGVSSLFAINAVDYDNDRDLDLFICGYTLTKDVNPNDVFANPMPFHDANNGATNIMLRNEGGWSFTDVTEQIGLDQNTMRFSYASSWDDYDDDGDLDLYVANDFGRNNLYRNDNGQFNDVAAELGVEDIGPGMSASWGDFNNDGRPDLYVSNMFSAAGNRITHNNQFKTEIDETTKGYFQRHARGNSLFENAGDGSFVDRSVELGVTLGRWAWGSIFVDINNDGWEDLYVTNGFVTADDTNDL